MAAKYSNVNNAVTASKEAINFFKSITNEDLDACLFKDELVFISGDHKTQGELTISVERAERVGEMVLLIAANSHGKLDGIPTKSSLTACLRKDLTVIEQHQLESIKVPSQELEKTTALVMHQEAETLQVERQIRQGDTIRSSSHTYRMDEVEGLVTEASNLLLQRLLIKSQLGNFDDFVFVSIDPDSWKLLPTTYYVLPGRMQSVGTLKVAVRGIERTLPSSKDLPCTWQSFYTDDGHLARKLQIGSPIVATIRTLPPRIEEEEPEEKPVYEKQPLVWEEDLEMHSMFSERKEALKADHFTYLREHPDARAILTDFFQYILMYKPDDVVKFAKAYFSSFTAALSDSQNYHQSTSP